MILLGYAQNYYFHLRTSSLDWMCFGQVANHWPDRSPQEQRSLNGATQWKRTVCETACKSKVKVPVFVIIQHETESEANGLFPCVYDLVICQTLYNHGNTGSI
jgi:hypothetical protein